MTTEPTDAVPPAPRRLSRRQVVTAGAWAAPVVLLATATPARAQVVSPGTYTGPVIALQAAAAESATTVNRTPAVSGTMTMSYSAGDWVPAPPSAPASLTVFWVVTVTPSGGGQSRSTQGATQLTSSATTVAWSVEVPATGDYTVALLLDDSPSDGYDADEVVRSLTTVSVQAPPVAEDANVPANYLQVQAYSISDLNTGGDPRKQLQWNGAQIGYWSHQEPREAHFAVRVTVSGPAPYPGINLFGPSVALATGSSLTAGATIIEMSDGSDLPAGTYTATVTVIGNDGAENAVSSPASITIP